MTSREAPVFHPYRYSSFPGPGPVPVPPGSFFAGSVYRVFRSVLGKILGRKKVAAPSDAPMNGIGVAPGWLTDTRPVGLTQSLAGGHSLRRYI